MYSEKYQNNKEQILYLVKLFGLSEFKVKNLVNLGMSLDAIEELLEYQCYDDLLSDVKRQIRHQD